MTKADIVDKVHENLFYRNGYTKNECEEITELVLELMKRVLVKEGKLKIAGFGNFEVKSKRDRKGRNPHTGEELIISSRKVLTYKPSIILKNKINGIDKGGIVRSVKI